MRAITPAVRSPPPGTSTATASTTSSSGRLADGPGAAPGTRNMPATAMWCSASRRVRRRDRSRERCRRHRRLCDPRRRMRAIFRLFGLLRRRRQRRRLRRPHHRGSRRRSRRRAGHAHDAGDSYVVFGQAGGFGAAIDLANVAAGIGGFVIHGADADDRSGTSVSSAGDIDGDGFDDLIIGAPCRRSRRGARHAQRCRRQLRAVRLGHHRRLGQPCHQAGGAGVQTLTGSAAADDMVGGRATTCCSATAAPTY